MEEEPVIENVADGKHGEAAVVFVMHTGEGAAKIE